MFALNSDEKLIQRALQGSEKAWEKLVKRHETPVYNHLLRMTGNAADAMDLLQEVFLAVYRNLPNYRGSGSFLGWVMKVASNRALDLHRTRKRHPEQSISENWDAPCDNDPAEHYQQASRNREILKLLSSLPPEQRLVMELRFFQQQTFNEIGMHMGTPTATAKTRFYGAIKSLRELMEVDDVI